jgi:hypothetical protein
MTQPNIGTPSETETLDQTNTQVEKTYSQREVDDLMARTKGAVTKKLTSKYEDLGDPEELRAIVDNHRKGQVDQQIKRGEFDKILQDLATSKNAEIQKRDRLIEEFKLNSPIVDAAARHRAVNPEQIKTLVRGNVRLNADGEVEVLDEKGTVRYDDQGKPFNVDALILDFLNKNPHFVQATPSTSSTKSSVGNSISKLDINSLDMKNPEHRRIYAESKTRK